MRAKLIFNLPEEEGDFQDALRGGKYRIALAEVIVMLRCKTKHGHNYESTEQALQEIYEFALSMRNEAESSE